jgi:hypothetical protein
MSIDRDAIVRIKIAMTGGEAGTAIDRIVARMEAVEKRLGAIGAGASTSQIPARAVQGPPGLQQPLHVSPTPLPVTVTNFPGSSPSEASRGGGLWNKITAFFGGQRRAGGGVIQHRVGSGGDDEPCYLTPGELVLPVDVAQRLRQVMGSSGSGGRHYALGGWHTDPLTGAMGPSRPEYHLQGQKTSVQSVYVVNFNEMPTGGGGGPRGPKDASDSSGLIGNLAEKFAGPLAVVGAAAYGADKVMRQFTSGQEIMNNSRMNELQKMRAIEEEMIPFGKTLHALNDSFTQINDRLNKLADAHAKATVEINASAQKLAAQSDKARPAAEAVAMAQGMRSAGLTGTRFFDPTAPGAEIAQQNFMTRQAAQDAIVQAQRRSAGADLAVTDQQRRRDLAGGRNTESLGFGERADAYVAEQRREAARIARQPGAAATTGPWYSRGFGSRFFAARRDRAVETADNRESMAGGLNTQAEAINAQRNTGAQLLREEEALQQRMVTAEQNRLELAKARLGIVKAEADIAKQHFDRMAADAQRFGGMTRGSRRSALIAFQRVQQHVERGGDIDRLGEGIVGRAAQFDRREISRLQLISGERFAQQNAQLGGQQMREDWRTGGSLRDASDNAQRLAEQVRIGTDQVSVESADRMARLLTDALGGFYLMFEQRMNVAVAELRNQIAQRNASATS